MYFSQRHLARAFALDGFEDIGAFDSRLVRRSSRNYRNYGGVAETLGDGRADIRLCRAFMLLILGVLRGTQITGLGIQRLQQAVQRAVGNLRYIWFLDILAAHPREHLAVDLKLAISAIVAGSAHAAQA